MAAAARLGRQRPRPCRSGQRYGAGRLGGQVTLDGVRAAERFAPAELRPDTPVGLWGYSGGGFSTAWAAELQPSYAPELNVVGSAEGGVPADFNDLINTNKGSGAFGLVFAAAVGLSREYPAMGLSSVLNPRGLQLQNQISTLCVGRLLTVAPGLSFNYLTKDPNALDLPQVRDVIKANTPGRTVPAAPVLLYHSAIDNAVPVKSADELAASYCATGATVDYQRSSFTADHVLVAILGIPSVLGFFDARFAGAPPVSTCAPTP